jgi:hypothetical protein
MKPTELDVFQQEYDILFLDIYFLLKLFGFEINRAECPWNHSQLLKFNFTVPKIELRK